MHFNRHIIVNFIIILNVWAQKCVLAIDSVATENDRAHRGDQTSVPYRPALHLSDLRVCVCGDGCWCCLPFLYGEINVIDLS